MSAALPSFRLDGRRVLVTGAGRGIGLAIAQACAASGAEVTLCARSAGEIGAAADELRAQGLKAEALPADVTDVQSFAALIAARPAFDVFFNNAGMNRPKPLADITVEDYDAVLGLNLRSAVFAAKAVTAAMVEVGRIGDQHVLADGACRGSQPHDLLRFEMGAGGLHQGAGHGSCAPSHPRQHHLPDLCRDADDGAVLSRPGVPFGGAGEDSARSHWPRGRRSGGGGVPRIGCRVFDDRQRADVGWRRAAL